MNVDRSESVSAAIANMPVVEPDCLSRLFAQHYRRVLLAAYRILGNMADAEDIAQGVFLRLREAEMPAIANAGSYLYRAAINGALDLLRSRNRAALEPLDAADDIAGTGQGASPEADAFASELARWLRSAMGELTPRAAEMFALRYLEEFSNGEIAGLLLCSIGVYGMVSYSVSRSVRDIGIRMALGADGAKVMRHVLCQAMRPVLIGVVVGVALCAAVSGVLSSMMFGLGAHDPIAFISMPLFLLAVAFVATFIPGRRAMRVDPMVALRCE